MSYRQPIIVIILSLIFFSDSLAQSQITPDQRADLNERARDLEDQAGLLDIDTTIGGGSIDTLVSWYIEWLFNNYDKNIEEFPEDLKEFLRNNIDPETIREARNAEAKKLREEAARLRQQAMIKPTNKKQSRRAKDDPTVLCACEYEDNGELIRRVFRTQLSSCALFEPCSD